MLLVSDLLRVFDENYEPSRTRVWEIVRTVHPVHCAALLYLLENVRKSRRATPLQLPANGTDDERHFPSRSYETAVRPTLNLTRVTVTRQLTPSTLDGEAYIYDTRDAAGNLTVMGLLHVVRDCANERLTLEERVAIHNLRTHYYTRFVDNVRYFLLPDDMQADRNEFGTVDARSVTEKFLHYYRSLTAGDASLYYGGYTNPKSFRYITRPVLRRIDRRPVDSDNDYVVQPLYQGHRVVINCNERETRCYNCYGELLQGFMYNARFTVNATFEAIVLPLDRDGRMRSWRYGAHNNDKAHRVVVVVDVFRIDHRIMVDSPFVERAAHITSVGGTHVHVPPPTECTWESLERAYYRRTDLYDPIVGVVLRRGQDTCAEPPRAYRFNMTTCYDFLTNRVHRLAGSVALREFQRVHYNLDMADRRTVCTVYAHDESYYYVCTFDRQRFQFVHCAVLERLSDIARRRPKYTCESVYVLGARREVMGVMFLRVYYSAHDRAVVGFEHKLTTSMYDVPYKDPFLTT